MDAATHPRDHLLASLLWHTGARISEALAITPEHLVLQDEWSSGVLLDQLKKRGRPRQVKRQTMRKRWVPVTDERFILTLTRYVEGLGLKVNDRLFPFTRQWAYKRISQLSDRAALPLAVHPHTCGVIIELVTMVKKLVTVAVVVTLKSLSDKVYQ
ncbi:MAG: hypothetical protein ACTHWH_04230 [Marinobacter sp.]